MRYPIQRNRSGDVALLRLSLLIILSESERQRSTGDANKYEGSEIGATG